MESSIKYGGFLELSPLILAENLVRYTWRVLVPPLPLSLREFITGNPLIVPLALLVLVLPSLVLAFKRATSETRSFLYLMAGCFIISLLPVLGMKVSLFDTQSERFLYLPSVFASGFFTVSMTSLFKRSRFLPVTLVSAILF